MLVVSDTSPLSCLSAIDQLSLIPCLCGRVLVPPAVVSELAVPVAGLPEISPETHAFLNMVKPRDSDRVDVLLQSVDLGEAEAIALALEVRAHAIRIDEHLADLSRNNLV